MFVRLLKPFFDSIDPERTLAPTDQHKRMLPEKCTLVAVKNIRRSRMEAAGNTVSILVSCAAYLVGTFEKSAPRASAIVG